MKLSAAFVKEYIKIISSRFHYYIFFLIRLSYYGLLSLRSCIFFQRYLRVLGLLGLGVLGAFLPPDEMNFSRFFLDRFSKYYIEFWSWKDHDTGRKCLWKRKFHFSIEFYNQFINRKFVSLKTKIRNVHKYWKSAKTS